MTIHTITYKDTNGFEHDIKFHNLLPKGHNMDRFIQNKSLFSRPDHRFGDLLRLMKKESVVYDLGSYIGTFSIPMAIEGMDVYCFEGWPDNYTRCKKNTDPYNIKNYCVALSNVNKIEKTRFNHCQGAENDSYHDLGEIVYVRLDDFIKEKNLPSPDLIKVDIEGMESLAFHGMSNLLENVRPIWNMGYHYKFYSEVEGYPGWVDVEDGGFDFSKIGELDYVIFDQHGKRCPPSILQTRGGEFIFIPREKIRRLE